MPAPERSPDDLRRALEAEAAGLAAGPPDARSGVARAVRRQRMTRVAIAAPVVVLLLVAGVAFAASTEDTRTTIEVASGGAVDGPTTTTAGVEGSVTTTTTICVEMLPTDDPGLIIPYDPVGLEDDGDLATTTSIVDGEGAESCDTTTTSLPTCPTGTIPSTTIGEPAPACVPFTTTWIDPVGPTSDVPETTVPLDEPVATVPSTDTTAPGPAGEALMCGTISPSGWPTTAAPNPSITGCLVAAFERGDPATLVVVSYSLPDNDNAGDPAYRHEITYTVLGAGLVEVRTDWSSATKGPVGLVTTERCTGLTGFASPEVSGCTPA